MSPYIGYITNGADGAQYVGDWAVKQRVVGTSRGAQLRILIPCPFVKVVWRCKTSDSWAST